MAYDQETKILYVYSSFLCKVGTGLGDFFFCKSQRGPEIVSIISGVENKIKVYCRKTYSNKKRIRSQGNCEREIGGHVGEIVLETLIKGSS